MLRKLFGSKHREKKTIKVTLTEDEYELFTKQAEEKRENCQDEVSRLQHLILSTPIENTELHIQLSIDLARALHVPEEKIIHNREELEKFFLSPEKKEG